MSAVAEARCFDCGTSQYELERDEKGDALCIVCYQRRFLRRYPDIQVPYPDPPEPPSRNGNRKPSEPVREPAGGIEVVMADTVVPTAVRWAWDGWLPLGMLSALVGYPDEGKTTLAVRLGADMTNGTLDGALHGEPRTVLIASLEDVIDAVLVPRLMAAGADLSRVGFVRGRKAEDGTLDLSRHIPAIDAKMSELRAVFLLVDPLTAAMPGINGHMDTQIRPVLARLAALAERHSAAVLANMHFSKGATDPMLGALGGIGFVGAARSELVFGTPPNETPPTQARVLAHGKCNVGPKHYSLACRVEPQTIDTDDGGKIGTSRVHIGGRSPLRAEDLVGQRDRDGREARIEAVDFVRGMLTDGPMLSAEFNEQANGAGISLRTLRRAQKEIGVEAFQRARKWHVRLSSEAQSAKAEFGTLSPDSEPEPRSRAESSECQGGSECQPPSSECQGAEAVLGVPPGWQPYMPPNSDSDDREDWRQR